MVLRNRQLRGIPLSWWPALFLTVVSTLMIPFIAEHFWFKLLPFIPDGLRPWLIYGGMIAHLGQSGDRVPQGKERAQLFFGMYTGISFPAGICFQPRLPFPIISLILRLFFGKNVAGYLGWILEGDVRVESITSPFVAEGLTSDGIRVKLSGTLVFEIENAAVYLSQTRDGYDRSAVLEALPSESSAHIKERVITRHTAKELHQGEYQGGKVLTQWITEACSFVEDFGLCLARAPIVKVDIESERIQRAFDVVHAKKLVSESAAVLSEQYALIKERNPGISEEGVLFLLNLERSGEGLPNLTMANIKVK